LNYRGPRRRIEKKEYEKIFEEIIVENFPNIEKKIVNQAQELQRVLYKRIAHNLMMKQQKKGKGTSLFYREGSQSSEK